MALAWLLAAALLGGALRPALGATEIVVATVNNFHMVEMQRLTPRFEAANPDIRVRWVTLEEGELRQALATDVAREAGAYDVVTIGMYETQVWGRKGKLLPLALPAEWDADDLLPALRSGLTLEGRLHAAPFYGESSMLLYRKDLVARAGIALPDRPSWRQLRDAAAKLHDPAGGVYGICLRGKPGWGDNMALVQTMVNAHGGQWFDMGWRPQLQTRPWREAVTLYVELLQKFGPPGAVANSYNELLELFSQGRCAMWVDATIAAAYLDDPAHSKVAGRVGYAQAPSAVTAKGASWLWAWSLAVPVASRHPAAAQRFVAWATSKAYIALVAAEGGRAAVPTGTRRSTYALPALQPAAALLAAERRAIDSVHPEDSTLPRSPYVGVQYVAIPEFQAIGIAVGQQIARAVTGRIDVAQALAAGQQAADLQMRRAGYY